MAAVTKRTPRPVPGPPLLGGLSGDAAPEMSLATENHNGAPLPLPLSIASKELAALFGVADRTLRDLADRGVVLRVGRGRYALAESVTGYIDHLRDIAAGRGGEAAVLELSHERALLAREQRVGHELKNAERRGELLPKSNVVAEWSTILRRVSSGVMAVPSRVRQQRPHFTAADIALIDRELRDVLTAIGNDEPATAGDAPHED